MVGKTILVIDDDEAISEVLELVLRTEGYNVIVDMAGSYFDEKHTTYPDLVLLDLLLPGRSGKDICLSVKQNSVTAHIPVIIVSANTPREVEAASKAAGADEYITKPFEVNHLLSVVQKHLSN